MMFCNTSNSTVASKICSGSQKRNQQGAESVVFCGGIVIELLCYQNITTSGILHRILKTDGQI